MKSCALPAASSRWWATFLAGAAAGLAAGVALGARGRTVETPEPGEPRATERGDDGDGWPIRAWAGAMDGLEERVEQARGWLARPGAPDLAALAERIAALPGGEGVRVRDLGDGIVEVVGSAPDDEAARALLRAMGDTPGVRVVVNRVWTPSSAVHNVPGL